MELFVAICIDRHIDEYVRVFSTYEKALECCENFINVYSSGNDYEEDEDDGYELSETILYSKVYSCEGDIVKIEKRILDLDNDE